MQETGYANIPEDATIQATAKALEANGFRVTVVENGEAAKKAALDLLPKGAEVLTVTSRTVDQIGLTSSIDESGDYQAIRPKLNAMWGDPSKKHEQRRLGAAPEHVVGSVHALTQEGHALIASQTGSQLPAYVYGAGHVVWVVGAQKITKNMDDAFNRLETHVIPLEDKRALEAYGNHTSANKIVLFKKEITPDRVDIIIAKEALGF